MSMFWYQCWIYDHFPTICGRRVQHSLVGPHGRGYGNGDSHIQVVLLRIGGGSIFWLSMMSFGHHTLVIYSTVSLSSLHYIQVICSGRPWLLDTFLRSACEGMVMFRVSHDQFHIYNMWALVSGFRVTS